MIYRITIIKSILLSCQKYFFWFGFVCVTVFVPITSPLSDPSDNFLNEDISFEDIYSDLPDDFNIEQAGEYDFLRLPFFTEEDAVRIVTFRESLKKGDSLYSHLEDIPGLSPLQRAVLNHLAPAAKPEYLPVFSASLRKGLVHRPGQESFSEGKYYFKLHGKWHEKVSVTFLGERDPFEPRALDLFSGNVSMKSDNDRVYILLGDYRPGFGQGLLFSRYGRSYSSGADVFVRESKTTANTFFEESYFLRGCYVSVRRRWFNTFAWTSVRDLDATIDENGDAVTIKDSGYHYSGDIRDNLNEKITAARIALSRISNMELALTGAVSNYSPALAPRNVESNINDPQGNTFKYVTIDGKLQKDSALLFFEHAVMDMEESATLGGLNMKSPRIRGTVLFRYYSKGYRAPRSGAFSAFGKTENEKGMYSAVQADLTPAVRLNVSMDLARTLYRTYSSNMPLSRKRVNVLIQTRLPERMVGSISGRVTDDSVGSKRRWNSRLKLEKRPGRDYIPGWRSGLAWSECEGEGGPFAEAGIYMRRQTFKFDLSAGIFDIPSYASRFYYYERNVPGRGRTGAVWGRGGTLVFLLRLGTLSVRYLYKDSDLMKRINEISIQCDINR